MSARSCRSQIDAPNAKFDRLALSRALTLAREGTAVDVQRAERFARGVLEMTDLGRMAMAVLEGGLLTGTRLIELAEGVLAASSAPRKTLVGA